MQFVSSHLSQGRANTPRRVSYLCDDWREPQSSVRIAIDTWYPLCRVENQFIERPHRIGLVWQYLKRLGPVAVWRKVRSRLGERTRNRKIAAVGRGIVLEAPTGTAWHAGDRVAFFAPNHPENCRRLCVDERFVVPAAQIGSQCGANQPGCVELPPELAPYIGWSAFSGLEVDRQQVLRGLGRLFEASTLNVRGNETFTYSDNFVQERIEAPPPRNSSAKPTAVLFGLGNYAKTQIVPHIRRRFALLCVHEIDPDQLYSVKDWGVGMDTSPRPRENERYDAWFIAGYHHTHTELALQALRDQAYAVVEKPLATSWRQYEALRMAVQSMPQSMLFACFHKRYSIFNEWARSDLGVEDETPVDMHCIVYEIPLPHLHWYNWPNSGSRLVSNGCHWIDYFLFMNGYCSVEDVGVWPTRDSDLAAFVRLENGATLVMSLTDTGSSRLGVRDLIELRAGEATVRITDSTFYESENTSKVLRRRRINPMKAYRSMYKTICRRIADGQAGDELKSLRSTELMLRLEDELRTKHVSLFFTK